MRNTVADERASEKSGLPAGAKRNVAWPGLLPVALALVVMSWLSWRKWAHLFIDFGTQLYIPWQLSSGAVLYRDVMYLPGGPLSNYYHAVLFNIFGVSLNVVLASNFVILILLLGLVHRCFLKAADPMTAMTAGLAIVMVFAFSQYMEMANFNYISPYAHEVTHGLFLTIVLVVLLSRWLTTRHLFSLATGGLCFGLIFLTKPDIFVAAALVVLVAFGVLARSRETGLMLRSTLVFLLCALLPLLGFFVYFRLSGDTESSLQSVCWAWVPLRSEVMEGHFYRVCLGLDTPWLHLRLMFWHVAVLAFLVVIVAWRFRPAQHRMERIILLGLLGAIPFYTDWVECGRGLPLIGLCALAAMTWQYRVSGEPARYIFPLLWMVMSLGMMAKTGLHARIYQYGVFLCMPMFIAAIYFLLWLLPRMLSVRGVHPAGFRGAMLVMLLAGFVRLAIQSAIFYDEKTVVFGAGGDRIYLAAAQHRYDPDAEMAGAALAWLDANARAEETLAVLPEGAMFNYLARRRNPTPYIGFNPTEVALFDEAKMLEEYQRNSPDYIMVVHREMFEFAMRSFGQEARYGRAMMDWVKAGYETVYLIGHEPLQKDAFGIKILKRKPQRQERLRP